MELLGHFEAGPLHSHGGGQAEDDAQAAEHAEHRQIPRVTEVAVLQHKLLESMSVTLRLFEKMRKSEGVPATQFACTAIIRLI